MLQRAILIGACVVALGAANQNENPAPAKTTPSTPHRVSRQFAQKLYPKLGAPVSIQLAGLDGQPINTAALRGKMILVNCWATSCGDSMNEMAHLLALENKYKDMGFVILGVPLDQDRDRLQSALKDKGADWRQSFDTQDNTTLAWAECSVQGTASGALISPEGKLLWHGLTSQIDEPLAKAMEEHPPTVLASAKKDASNAPASDSSLASASESATATSTTASPEASAIDAAKPASAKSAPAEVTDETKSKSALSIAQSYEHSGMTDKAKAKYQDIIDKYPNTPAAGAARQALDGLSKN